jgi:hypothetical protein
MLKDLVLRSEGQESGASLSACGVWSAGSPFIDFCMRSGFGIVVQDVPRGSDTQGIRTLVERSV